MECSIFCWKYETDQYVSLRERSAPQEGRVLVVFEGLMCSNGLPNTEQYFFIRRDEPQKETIKSAKSK